MNAINWFIKNICIWVNKDLVCKKYEYNKAIQTC